MKSNDELLEKCTLEDLERAGYMMYQLKEGFRFGTDSALLSWFAAGFVRTSPLSNTAKVTKKEIRALELGAGCGACSLLLCARRPNIKTDAVEIMKLPFEVLKENIKLNGLEGRLRAFHADIRELPPEVKEKQYDLVLMNPPFFLSSRGTRASEELSVERLNGRFEENGNLEDFVRTAAARVIPSSGYIVMVMKGNRLKDCLMAFEKASVSPVRLMTVHSFEDKEASMILLAGKRGNTGSELRILPPLILNERKDEGEISPAARLKSIYEDDQGECFI